MREFGGRLPQSEDQLATLPGIGRYTAAALASIAFGRPCAVVDGNVERVLNRMLAQRISRAQLRKTAQSMLSRRRPGDFNQAMMELGATICVPAAPGCEQCPLRPWCATRGELPAAAVATRRKRRACYLLAIEYDRVFLVQRPAASSLMPLMWELPAGHDDAALRSMTLRHAITNTDYVVAIVRGEAPVGVSGRWTSFSRLRQLPLTGLARKVLRRAGINL